MDAIFGDSAPIIIATMTARQMVSAYLVFGFFFPLFFFCGISARSRVRARARARIGTDQRVAGTYGYFYARLPNRPPSAIAKSGTPYDSRCGDSPWIAITREDLFISPVFCMVMRERAAGNLLPRKSHRRISSRAR